MDTEADAVEAVKVMMAAGWRDAHVRADLDRLSARVAALEAVRVTEAVDRIPGAVADLEGGAVVNEVAAWDGALAADREAVTRMAREMSAALAAHRDRIVAAVAERVPAPTYTDDPEGAAAYLRANGWPRAMAGSTAGGGRFVDYDRDEADPAITESRILRPWQMGSGCDRNGHGRVDRNGLGWLDSARECVRRWGPAPVPMPDLSAEVARLTAERDRARSAHADARAAHGRIRAALVTVGADDPVEPADVLVERLAAEVARLRAARPVVEVVSPSSVAPGKPVRVAVRVTWCDGSTNWVDQDAEFCASFALMSREDADDIAAHLRRRLGAA